ncbi:hypothetical protein BH23THE1_BH23THE1_05050 [soil metagenome]
MSANQILDAANMDSIANQDKLVTSFEGSLVEPEINKAEGSESTFNKEIILLMRCFN